MAKSWKCDFCKYHTIPYKPGNEQCSGCTNKENMFVLRKFMHPKQAHDWDLHQRLERFIDRLDVELMIWQREVLHQNLDRRFLPPIHARACGRSIHQINLDMLWCRFYISMLSEEKRRSKP